MDDNLKRTITIPMAPFLVIVALFLVCAASPASGLKVSGVILQGTAEPGDNVSFNMEVGLRPGDAPTNFSLDAMDWVQSIKGENQAVQSNPGPYSLKDLLVITPQRFYLEPNTSKTVTVNATIPKDAIAGGRYAIVSVHSAPEEHTAQSSISNQLAINALVAVTVSGPGIHKAGEVTSFAAVKPVSGSEQNMSLLFNNTGNIHTKIKTEATLKDKDGITVANVSVPYTSYILPGAARIIDFSFKPERRLKAGAYTAKASSTLDDGTVLSSKTTEFDITS